MFVYVVLALLGTASAVPRNPQRIVGGEATTIEQFPFMASMQYSFWGSWYSHSCGGTLLTRTSILSAANCFFGDSANQWKVRLGSTNSKSGGSEHLVQSFILHADYNPRTIENDVAIVRLTTPAVYGDSINRARIAGLNYILPDNTVVSATGWGTLSAGNQTSLYVLQKIDLSIDNHVRCTERYANLKSLPGFENWPDVTPEMLCVRILDVGGNDACQGESGGPLIHQNDVVIGITSWGYSCADPIYPGVNVRVSSYTDWITRNSI